MINKYTAPIFLTLISLMNLPAYAGFERAKTMMEKVQSGLSMLALCTVGVAVIFVGYKIYFWRMYYQRNDASNNWSRCHR